MSVSLTPFEKTGLTLSRVLFYQLKERMRVWPQVISLMVTPTLQMPTLTEVFLHTWRTLPQREPCILQPLTLRSLC